MIELLGPLTLIATCLHVLERNAQNSNSHTAVAVADRSPEAHTETGPMVYFADDPHGSNDREYRFNYRKVNNSWRAYILRMPDLRGRDASSMVTHRLSDDGGAYICWNSDVRTLKDMQAISRVWANSIQEYISTGKRFGPQ